MQPVALSFRHDVYYHNRATAAPAVMLATVGAGVFRGLANMRAPLLITLGTNAVHLAVDLVLMFHMGQGIKGAAISTAASEWLAAVAYGGMIWQRRDVLGLWPPPQIPVGEVRRRLMPFLQAGTAVVMRTGSLLGTKTLATAVAARLGPGAVASHQVLMSETCSAVEFASFDLLLVNVALRPHLRTQSDCPPTAAGGTHTINHHHHHHPSTTHTHCSLSLTTRCSCNSGCSAACLWTRWRCRVRR